MMNTYQKVIWLITENGILRVKPEVVSSPELMASQRRSGGAATDTLNYYINIVDDIIEIYRHHHRYRYTGYI